MEACEFYVTPEGEVTIRETGKPERMLTEHDVDYCDAFISELQELYPEALAALREIYSQSKLNRSYYNFLIVRRFCKCNFGCYDNKLDIDGEGKFVFEFVSCPLRGECRFDHVICQPKFNVALSDRQMEVMRLFFQGKDELAIAEKLFLAPNTVLNHKKMALQKLGFHSLNEFIRYAYDHKIFEK